MPASVSYPRPSLRVPSASKELFYEQLEDFDAHWVDDWAHARTELELDLRPLPEVPTDGDPWGCDDFESTALLQSVHTMPELDDPDLLLLHHHHHHEDTDHHHDEDNEDDDDADFFDFGEDAEDLVVYYPYRVDDDEDEGEEVAKGEDEGQGEGEDEDGEDDDETFVENDEVVFRPLSSDIAPDDDSEEEEFVVQEGEEVLGRSISPCISTTHDTGHEEDINGNEDIVSVLDPSVPSNDDDTSPIPQSVWSPQTSKDSVVDRAPTSSIKSRLRQQKRRRSDDDGGDDDGDDSGEYGAPICRPRKTRRTCVNRDTTSPLPEPEIPSAADTPGRHNGGGAFGCRVTAHPELVCGFPGCKEVLNESDQKSLKRARAHYRSHFKDKHGVWLVPKDTLVTCNWSGCCNKPFKLSDMACLRHLEDVHFGIEYRCPKCRTNKSRNTILEDHMRRCLGPRME